MSLAVIAALIAVLWIWRVVWRRLVAPVVSASASCSKSSIVYGGEVKFNIEIHNPSRLPAPLVTCEFELPKGLSVQSLTDSAHEVARERMVSVSVSLRPRETVKVSYTLYGIRRGKQRFTDCTLQMSNGFMPGHLYKKVYVDEAVVVHPKKQDTTLTSQRVSRLGPKPALRKLYPTSLDWIDIRPYTSTDSIRDVHWMTSARRGELIVLERASSVANHAVVVVSTQVAREFWTPNESLAEASLQSAHALMLRLVREGSMVTLYTNVDTRRSSGSLGRHNLITVEGPSNPKLEFLVGHTIGALPVFAHTEISKVLREVERAVHDPTRMFLILPYRDTEIDGHVRALIHRGHAVEVVSVRTSSESTEDTQERQMTSI